MFLSYLWVDADNWTVLRFCDSVSVSVGFLMGGCSDDTLTQLNTAMQLLISLKHRDVIKALGSCALLRSIRLSLTLGITDGGRDSAPQLSEAWQYREISGYGKESPNYAPFSLL